MDISWSVQGLADFVYHDCSDRAVGFCGPTCATRLASTCTLMAELLSPDNVQIVCASLNLAATSLAPSKNAGYLVPTEIESIMIGSSADLLPAPQMLRALCFLSSKNPGDTTGVDWLYFLLAHGADTRLASFWARAFRKHGIASLIDRKSTTSPCSHPEHPISQASDEHFFSAIFDKHIGVFMNHLGNDIPLDVSGPKIMGSDPGCCRFTPLAAAVAMSARSKKGNLMVSLLLEARANVNHLCHGPCGWTPLMIAVTSTRDTEVFRQLVHAQADLRIRHQGNGNTALDMADKNIARCLREARDSRPALSSSVDDNEQQPMCINKHAQLAASRGKPANARLALAHAVAKKADKQLPRVSRR